MVPLPRHIDLLAVAWPRPRNALQPHLAAAGRNTPDKLNCRLKTVCDSLRWAMLICSQCNVLTMFSNSYWCKWCTKLMPSHTVTGGLWNWQKYMQCKLCIYMFYQELPWFISNPSSSQWLSEDLRKCGWWSSFRKNGPQTITSSSGLRNTCQKWLWWWGSPEKKLSQKMGPW